MTGPAFKLHEYLSVPQSIGSITIQLAAIYLAPEVGFYFICIIFIILGFGALRTTGRETRVLDRTFQTDGFGRDRCNRPGKFSGPSLLEPSLKVKRNYAHNQSSAFVVAPV